MSDQKKGGGFLPGIIFGAIAGAVGGLLFAPKKGEETRQQIKDEYKKVKEKADEAIGDLKERKEEWADKVSKKANEVGAKAKEAKQKVEDRLAKKALEDEKNA